MKELVKEMNLGVCLSGGGVRAIGFHLGVLARLAEEGLLEDVAFLSTVSGGSLVIGLVFALNGFDWPSSAEFLASCLPRAYRLLTTESLQSKLLSRVVRQLFARPLRLFGTRADDLALLLSNVWKIGIDLRELPAHPRWIMNATCYETGKNWRFERKRMGDYVFGYTSQPRFPVAEALAASAGFPGLIGPLPVDCRPFEWFRFSTSGSGTLSRTPISPRFAKVHLWDGGVYDNLGLEALSKVGQGWRDGVDFLISSDASGSPQVCGYSRLRAMLRLTTGIMMDQNRSLRSRGFVQLLRDGQSCHRGALIRIGRTAQHILQDANRVDLLEAFAEPPLEPEHVERAARTATSLKCLGKLEFELLYRNGFETADCVLHSYNPDMFGFVGRHCEFRKRATTH